MTENESRLSIRVEIGTAAEHDIALPVGRSKTVPIGTAIEHDEALPIKATLRIPINWMIRGFELAVARLRDAATPPHEPGNARDLAVAFFEVGNWLDALRDRFPMLAGSPHVKAVLFARNRTHHNFASCLCFDKERGEWKWHPVAVFPVPEDPKHANKKGERAYERVAAHRPLVAVLREVEQAVQRLTS